MKHFVIISSGAYSDYTPAYFMGDIEISQKEFNEKGKEFSDLMIEEFQKLPIKLSEFGTEIRYNPENNEEYPSPDKEKWTILMEKWLTEKGFEKLPDNIPEINIDYDVLIIEENL